MMRTIQYTAGKQLGVVCSRGVALLGEGFHRAAAVELWSHLDRGVDMAEILQFIADVYEQRLSAIPSFTVVLFGSVDAHVAVRGELMVSVATAAGDTSISGSSVSTWSELRVAQPISAATGSNIENSDNGEALPLVSGIVKCSAIEIVWDPLVGAFNAESGNVSSVVGTTSAAGLLSSEVIDSVPGAEVRKISNATLDQPMVPIESGDSRRPEQLSGPERETHPGVMEVTIPPSADLLAEMDEDEGVSMLGDGTDQIATDNGSDYDFLWGATIPRTVEEAAVRLAEESDDSGSTSVPRTEPRDIAPMPGAPEPQNVSGPVPYATPRVENSDGLPPGTRRADVRRSADSNAHEDAEPLGSGGMIDSVPDRFLRPDHMASALAASTQANTGSTPSQASDSLSQQPSPYHDVVVEPDSDAMVANDLVSPSSSAAAFAAEHLPPGQSSIDSTDLDVGDHDGSTIMKSTVYSEPISPNAQAAESFVGPVSEMVDPLGQAGPPTAEVRLVGAVGPGAQQVLAALCSQNHPNPPHAVICRYCQEQLAGDPVLIDRPSLGRMQISTGGEVDLDRSAILGRRPKALRMQGDALPNLVTVPSPQQDISRNHLEIRLEGWHVLAVDLDSKNGTTLIRQGQAPVLLQPSEPLLVRHGDVLDLGDGVMVLFEDIA